MTQPTLVVWCPDEGCARYLEEETVPAYLERGKYECRFICDEECPECGATREMVR